MPVSAPVSASIRVLLGVFCLFFFNAAGAQYENQAVILQYHHVSTSTPPVTSLSPAAFETHMRYLADNGFTVLPLEQVVSALMEGSPLPDRSAVITFDDGYTSVFEVALPVLRQYGWPFTVFVTAGLVGSNDRLYSTWDQIRAMGEAGGTIANHTVSHPYLLERTLGTSESEWLDGVRREILDAERMIAEETGQNHRLLAYPYGEYNPQIQALVRELGFTGIAQHSGPVNGSSDFTALPRFPFSGIYASMNTYPTKVQSLAFSLDAIQPDSPVTNSSMPGATLDFSNSQEGIDQLACFNNNEPISVVTENRPEKVFRISTHVDNRSRRFRYNCTAPGQNGRYYWYSIPWVNPAIAE
jgi:peptidoglycan/xylan/chitin deacetylase (PgdA/CDA1 family)